MTTPSSEIGQQHPQPDPRGWLVFTSLPAPLQNAEDSTQAADRDRWIGAFVSFDRPATPTERLLLGHLGHDVPDALVTTVSYPSTGVRRRRWLTLETAPAKNPPEGTTTP